MIFTNGGTIHHHLRFNARVKRTTGRGMYCNTPSILDMLCTSPKSRKPNNGELGRRWRPADLINYFCLAKAKFTMPKQDTLSTHRTMQQSTTMGSYNTLAKDERSRAAVHTKNNYYYYRLLLSRDTNILIIIIIGEVLLLLTISTIIYFN